ncbi:unnamed protein product [Allacma fusca]|uniref:Uncharacterized protein n=1 Tax=Allacma fusca TaxID=39272 RepID=A0A8J2P715_9HEXA|nr:unnamed protein product [Allacma fusca]
MVFQRPLFYGQPCGISPWSPPKRMFALTLGSSDLRKKMRMSPKKKLLGLPKRGECSEKRTFPHGFGPT